MALAPGYIVTTASVIQCPHGGTASIPHVLESVLIDGQPAAVADAVGGVAGCPFQPACRQITWIVDDAALRVDGRPLLTTGTVGMCESGEGDANGAPRFVTNQLRVEG